MFWKCFQILCYEAINDCNLHFLIVDINNAGLLKKSISSVFSYNWSKQKNMDNQLYLLAAISVVLLAIANGKSFMKVSQHIRFFEIANFI